MQPAEPEWVFADAWIFTAIGMAPPPCDLSQLVRAADGTNHAIVLDDEVESALGKLRGAGLLLINDDWTFELTETGRALFARRRGNQFSQVDSVTKLLRVTSPGKEPVRLPLGALARAIKDYLARPSG